MKLLSPALGLALLLGACMTTESRDRPLSEVYRMDSAAQATLRGSLTPLEQQRMTLAAQAYGTDSNALNRRTINQLIDEGEALQRNKPMYNE